MDLEDSVEECPANNNLQLNKNKSTQPHIMNFLELTRKPLLNKSERPSEKKPSNNILIKVEILINSSKSLTPMKSLPILKKDSFTTNMERKVFKMVDHLEEQEDLVIFSASLVEEVKERLVPEKPSQNLSKSKLHLTKFTMDV